MSKWILGLTIPVVFLSGLIPARAALLEYDFVGHVVVNDGGPLASVLNPFPNTISNVVTGYLRYDPTTADSTPGIFNLASAVFHAQYQGIALDATGVTATVSINRDLIVFTASIPPSEFLPVSVTSASISLGFQTFTDNFFSLTALPTTVPPNDHTLGLSYMSGGVAHGASTDTDLIVTSRLVDVPEPFSLTLLGTGLGILAVARNRMAKLPIAPPAAER